MRSRGRGRGVLVGLALGGLVTVGLLAGPAHADPPQVSTNTGWTVALGKVTTDSVTVAVKCTKGEPIQLHIEAVVEDPFVWVTTGTQIGQTVFDQTFICTGKRQTITQPWTIYNSPDQLEAGQSAANVSVFLLGGGYGEFFYNFDERINK